MHCGLSKSHKRILTSKGASKVEDRIIERIGVPEGTLIINRHYMALQTPDGVLHPADLDEYGQYQPILELIRLISCNADLAEEITEGTRSVLRQAFVGEHPLLSYPLVGTSREKEELLRIVDVMNPQTQEDFVRTLCLIYSEGLFSSETTSYPFVCREELRDYLCQYINEEYVFELSEAVRKGKLHAPEYNNHIWDYYREELMLLPSDIVEQLSIIKYLPRKSISEYIVRYTIIAANSLIKNDGSVILWIGN